MFRDFKRGGYNLESTVSGKRLIAAILMIAFFLQVRKLNGWVCRNMSVVSKEYGRAERRQVHVGLYGHTWVNYMESM